MFSTKEGHGPSHPEQKSTAATSGDAEAPKPATEHLETMALDDIFRDGPPKHAIAGFSQGVRNMGVGLGLGVAGLCASTAIGATEGGLLGGAAGLATGVGALGGLTGYGLYSGARQMMRGVANTPEAIRKTSSGDHLWDSNSEQWVRVDLAKDFAELPTTDGDIIAKATATYTAMSAELGKPQPQSQQAGGGTGSANAAPTDGATSASPGQAEGGAGNAAATDYYAFLEVPKTATQAEIKKAYMRKALEMHPDKNPNDDQATRKFQELMEVYHVLSDPTAREQYDRYGPSGAPGASTGGGFDGAASQENAMEQALAMQFLEPLIGKPRFFLHFQPNTLYTSELHRELHHRRRLRIAQNLCRFLDNGEQGLEQAQLIIRDAVSTPIGPAMVACAAEQYTVAYRQFSRSNVVTRETDSFFSSRWMQLRSLGNSAISTAQAMYRTSRKTMTEQQLLDLLASTNEYDVKQTVLQACRMVLQDQSVSPEKRATRAKQLERLAAIGIEEVEKEVTYRQAAAEAEQKSKGTPGQEAA